MRRIAIWIALFSVALFLWADVASACGRRCGRARRGGCHYRSHASYSTHYCGPPSYIHDSAPPEYRCAPAAPGPASPGVPATPAPPPPEAPVDEASPSDIPPVTEPEEATPAPPQEPAPTTTDEPPATPDEPAPGEEPPPPEAAPAADDSLPTRVDLEAGDPAAEEPATAGE
jgi:hypothetical protein